MENGNVKDVAIDTDTFKGTFVTAVSAKPNDPNSPKVSSFRTEYPPGNFDPVQLAGRSQPQGCRCLVRQKKTPPTVVAENSSGILMNIIAPMIPWIFFGAIIWFFVFRQLRN